jgi:hypothetical protein
MDEVASPAPELEVGADRQPAKGAAVVLPGLGEPFSWSDLHVVAGRLFRDAQLTDEHDVDVSFLFDLPDRGLGDRLAFLDSTSGDDGRVLRQPGDVEDEQLVGARLRVLAGDVGGDRRAGSQVFWARILALYARFFS